MNITNLKLNSITSEGDLVIKDSNGNPQITVSPNGVSIPSLQRENSFTAKDREMLNRTNEFVEYMGSQFNTKTNYFKAIDVTCSSVTIKKETSFVGNKFVTNGGTAYIYGLDENGEPDPWRDGYILYDGEKVFIPRNPKGTGITIASNAPVYVGDLNRGYILFDTRALTTGNQWTIATETVFACAFCIKVGDQWKYDNNTSFVNFTPNEYTVAIGTMTTNNTGHIEEAEIWSQATSIGTIGGTATRDGQTIEQIVSNYQSSGDNVIDTLSFEVIIEAPSITTTGGDVLIKTVLDTDTVSWSGTIEFNVAIFEDGSNLVAKTSNKYKSAQGRDIVFFYKTSPSAGTIDYDIRGRLVATGNGNVSISYCYVEVIELNKL